MLRPVLLILATILSYPLSVSHLAAETIDVEIVTSEGTITLELYPDQAPLSVGNFLKYVENGHYEGTIFHRVIPAFMIQGGGMTADFKDKETLPPIRNEAGNQLKNEKYTIAMARLNDAHSTTSQFYINSADNPALDREQAAGGIGYAVFGKVTKGQDVVDKISNMPTQDTPAPDQPGGTLNDVPKTAVVIQSVKVLD